LPRGKRYFLGASFGASGVAAGFGGWAAGVFWPFIMASTSSLLSCLTWTLCTLPEASL